MKLAPGPNVMALLTVSNELVLAEAGNSAHILNVFHGLTGNFGLCECRLLQTSGLREPSLKPTPKPKPCIQKGPQKEGKNAHTRSSIWPLLFMSMWLYLWGA